MPHEITCVGCQRMLRIAEGNPRPTLTCPHCLALVVNPGALVRTDARADSITAEQDEGRERCPACGAATEMAWRRCPHCEEPLGRRRLSANDNSLDEEARQGNRAVGISAAVLCGLVATGVIIFFASGGFSLVSAGQEGSAVLVIGISVLGAILAGTIAVAASSKHRALTTVTSVFGGLLIGAGIVVLAIVLFCLGIMQTCANCGKGGMH